MLGPRLLRAGVARLVPALAFVLVVAVAAAFAQPAAAVDVYFLQGEQAVPVTREGADAEAAVAALLAGPTAEARRRGIRSQVPSGVPLRDVSVTRGVATVDLQLTLFVVDNRVQRVLHVASGKAGYDADRLVPDRA